MRFLLGFLLAVSAFAQPTVSNVRLFYDLAPNGATPHSYNTFKWNVNSSACYHRVLFTRHGFSDGDILFNGDGVHTCQTNDLGFPLSGLAPFTQYDYQVESSFDNSTWSTPVTGSFTTAALPTQHPALPQISGLWQPTFPNTSGYATHTTATNCSDLNTLIAAAVTLQPTNGTVITIPNEALASAACGPVQFTNDTQYLTVPEDSGHVNTTTGVFTASNSVSGWTITNGQTVILGISCLPGSLTQGNDGNSFNAGTQCQMQGPLTSNVMYYIVGASGSTFQLSATLAGSPIIPGDTGSPGGTMGVGQWPPMNQNYIVIQTSTPDAIFCPSGVRCLGSIWQSKMAHIQAVGGVYNANGGNTAFFTHNVWFRGIDLDAQDTTALANASIDPQATNSLFYAPQTWVSSYIVFDRSYIHCPPFPNRCESIFNAFGGRNMAVIDSDLENWNFWRPSATPTLLGNAAEGLSGLLAGSTVTIIPGTIKAPVPQVCTTTANCTFTVTGGTATGTGFVYLSHSCVPTLAMPSGMTGTCTGSATDISSVSHNCSVITATDWPRNPSPSIDAFTLGQFVLTGGTPSSYSQQQNFSQSAWFFEGTQGIAVAGQGPGPFSFLGNYLEGTGLMVHLDDSSIVDPQSVWFRQNTFFWDQKHKMGSATSDGYEYANRNGPECKHCRMVKFDGNIVTGMWNSVSLTGPAILFHTASNQGTAGTAGGVGQPGYTVQDIDVTNNTFWNVSAGIEVGGGVMDMTPQPAAARIRIKNNIFNTNAWTQTDGNTGEAGNGGGPGNPIEVDGAVEDMRIENNTFFDTRGSNPQIWHSQVNWIEGCLVQNNLLWFNQNAQGFSGEQNFHTVLTPAIGGIASALFNSQCTNDPNVAGGIMGNNVAVPYYNNSAAPSGFVTPSTICTSFGGSTLTLNACSGGTPLITTVLNGANAAANLAAIGFTAPTPVLATVPLNLKLLYNALCISGNHCTTDGTDMGADMNALLTAQGFVQTPTVGNITSTVAVVNWWTYDGSVACAVDYAVAPNDPSTQTGGGRQTALTGNSQSVTITAAAHSAILYRVLCPVSQPTGSFQLR